MNRRHSAHRLSIAISSVIIASAAARIGLAQDCLPLELQKIHAFGGGTGDNFGWSVAVDGEFAVIGEVHDDHTFFDTGTASVYRLVSGTWIFIGRVTSPDPESSSWFGYSVDIEGDVLVVGSPFHDTVDGFDAGLAYVYRFDGGNFVYNGTLEASDGHAFSEFGYSVSVSSYLGVERIAVGARSNDEIAPQAGAVYIFEYNDDSWEEADKITANDAAEDDKFGWSVSLSGRFLGVGAPGNDDAGLTTGSAYIYEKISFIWLRRATITADDAAAGDNFGWDVAIDDDATLLVGAYRNDEAALDAGAAYVFRRDVATWPQEAKLMASNALQDDCFGYSVALKDDMAIIGAVHDDTGFPTTGSAYVCQYDGVAWAETARLEATDGWGGDRLGWDVSTDGASVLVSASYSDDVNQDAGSAYFFPYSCPPEIGDMNCDDVVDMLDVAPFALALVDVNAYGAQYPACDSMNGDANEDSTLNGLDVSGFVQALLGN